MTTRREHRSPIFDDGMTVVAVGPETWRPAVPAPKPGVNPGLQCPTCGGDRTVSTNAYERRCPDCGRTFPKRQGRYRRGSRLERMGKSKGG